MLELNPIKIQFDETFTFDKLGYDFSTFGKSLNKIMQILTHTLTIKDNDFCAFTLGYNKEYQIHIFTLLMEMVLLTFFQETEYIVNFLHKYNINVQFLDKFIDDEYKIIKPILDDTNIQKEFIQILQKKYNKKELSVTVENIYINQFYATLMIQYDQRS